MKKIFDKKLCLLILLVIISLVLTAIRLGFGIVFLVVFVIWLLIFVLIFQMKLMGNVLLIYTILIFWFFSPVYLSWGGILNVTSSSNDPMTNSNSSSKKIVLVACTSTINNQPATLDGWKSTIYAAPLLDSAPGISAANSVRTFSYSGILNKTEANSLYARIERSDNTQYISGYGVVVEACDANNKAAQYYTTSDSDYVAGDGISAYESFLHSGNYLHGTGVYRIDVYVKTLDGKWHLIDRMTDIVVAD